MSGRSMQSSMRYWGHNARICWIRKGGVMRKRRLGGIGVQEVEGLEE